MVAVKDRVVVGDISVTQPSAMVKDLELHTFLPTIEDCIKLNNEFIFLIARVLTDRLPAWKCTRLCSYPNSSQVLQGDGYEIGNSMYSINYVCHA